MKTDLSTIVMQFAVRGATLGGDGSVLACVSPAAGHTRHMVLAGRSAELLAEAGGCAPAQYSEW